MLFIFCYHAIKKENLEWKKLERKEHPLRILYPFSFMIYRHIKRFLKRRDEKLFHAIRNLEISNKLELEKRIILFRCKQFSFCILCFFISISVSFLFFMKSETIPSQMIIDRNETGEGSKEIELALIKKGKEIIYPFTVQELPYTKEEWEKKLEEAITYVEKVMIGENERLDQVNKNLLFPKKIPNSGILVSYETSHRKWIDENGNVDVSEIGEEGELVEIEVTFRYENFMEIRTYTVHLIPKIKQEEEKEYEELIQTLKEEEEKNLYNKQFELPRKIGNYTIQYASEWKGKIKILFFIFLGSSFLFFCREEERVKEQLKEREEQLIKDYPEFLHQLILFISAGMTLKLACIRISKNYRKKRQEGKEKHYLYEELLVVTYELQAGISEEEVYRNLANRIGLIPYKKIIELLIQNLKKGSGNLIEMLIQEQKISLEMRKEQAKRLGEEASTKLLMPMILLLGIILLLVLYPAIEQFQFY